MSAAPARKAGLAFILVTLFLDVLGIGIIVPILPKLVGTFVQDDTGRTSQLYGLFIAVFALAQFFFSPILGGLSDRFGRRPVLLLSTLGQAVNYVLLASTTALGWLWVGRVLGGVTSASISTATAYIADVSPPDKRAQNFGFVGMAFGLGFIIGPGVGGLLGAVDLRLPFWVAAGLTLLNSAYGFFVLPESLAKEHRRPFSLARANPLGTLLALGRYPLVLGLVGSLFLAALAQRCLESTWVLATQYRYGWDTKMTGVSLALVGVGAAIVQGGLVRVVIPRLGERKALLYGLLLGAVSFVGYGLAREAWMVFALIPLNTLGGLSGPASQALLSKAVPPSEQGMLQGGLSGLVSLSQIVGPPLATSLFGYFVGKDAPFTLPGVSFFLGGALLAVSALWASRAIARFPGSDAATQ